ncbi:MAG: hypothetical protein HQL26_01665 [Candidatus Omnitrophica bacterium]|nr:hypothetical protein [Candidatus Omnitrophota bacterium]
MNKKIIFIISVMILIWPVISWAEEIEFEKDPFEVQMPIAEKPILAPEPNLAPTPNPNLNPEPTPAPEPTPPPPPPVKLSLPPFVVKGLVWNSDRPQAIIDNKVYNVGDVLPYTSTISTSAPKNNVGIPEGSEQSTSEDLIIKILSITKEGVAVSFQGETYTLKP